MKTLRIILIAVMMLLACGGSENKAVDKARAALARRDFPKAIAELDALRKKEDEIPVEARYILGQAYLGLNNLTEAEIHFKHLLEEADSLYRDSVALAFKKRGLELGKVGERELSIECFEYALRTSDAIDMSDAFSLMGELYSQYGEYGRAVHYYRKSLKTLADSTSRALTWEKLIRLLEKLGDPGDAYLATEEAMHEHHYFLESRYCQNGFSYAEDLLQRGLLDSADLIMTRVLMVPLPSMLTDDIYFLAGEIRLKQGDVEGAREAYREVLKLSTNASNVLIQRARDRLALLGEEIW